MYTLFCKWITKHITNYKNVKSNRMKIIIIQSIVKALHLCFYKSIELIECTFKKHDLKSWISWIKLWSPNKKENNAKQLKLKKLLTFHNVLNDDENQNMEYLREQKIAYTILTYETFQRYLVGTPPFVLKHALWHVLSFKFWWVIRVLTGYLS